MSDTIRRLELANTCGPADARTVPMDTGRAHGPLTWAAYAGACHRAHYSEQIAAALELGPVLELDRVIL